MVGINSFKYAKEFCSLLDVETPIKILFSLHFLRTDNVLLDIVLSLCNRVPSKSNKSSLHFFMSLFPFYFPDFSIIDFTNITLHINRAKPEPFDKANAGSPRKYRFSAFLFVIQTRQIIAMRVL